MKRRGIKTVERNLKSTSVNMSARLNLFFYSCVMLGSSLWGAPYRSSSEEDPSQLLRQLQHQIRNHESELRVFEEKINNQEIIVDSLRQQMTDAHDGHKEYLKGTTTHVDTKLTGLEVLTKGIQADLKPLKNHANDTSSVLNQFKQEIANLKKTIQEQNRTIEYLQTALKSLMEALQIKDPTPPPMAVNIGKTYKVQPGDSLEKIARINQTSIKALKEVNGLANDKIVVGQVLKLPEG